MRDDILISVKNLKKYFPVRRGILKEKKYIEAVDGVSLDIHKGETFGLVGESGCGKSTLGKCIIRMYDITSGEIYFKNKEIGKLKSNEIKSLRNNSMQIVFQDPYSALDPSWTVAKILSEPLIQKKASTKECMEKGKYLLNKVGMNEMDMEKHPYEFSGGQKQRIGIARALMANPEFVVCDEPISALDVSVQAQVINLLKDLQEEFGLTYLFASHDLSIVQYMSDWIGVMYSGKIVESGYSKKVYENPLHPYTKVLLAAIPSIYPEKRKEGIPLNLEILDDLSNVHKGCPFVYGCEYAEEQCRECKPLLQEVQSGHFVACFHYSGW
jgi:oligopeptide transport system ATP-binding protein